jgi:hypothetical protein
MMLMYWVESASRVLPQSQQTRAGIRNAREFNRDVVAIRSRTRVHAWRHGWLFCIVSESSAGSGLHSSGMDEEGDTLRAGPNHSSKVFVASALG